MNRPRKTMKTIMLLHMQLCMAMATQGSLPRLRGPIRKHSLSMPLQDGAEDHSRGLQTVGNVTQTIPPAVTTQPPVATLPPTTSLPVTTEPPTVKVTPAPTEAPTSSPTSTPTLPPTAATAAPTNSPSSSPTAATASPTSSPSFSPTTLAPTMNPTANPTVTPGNPTSAPTTPFPTQSPTALPPSPPANDLRNPAGSMESDGMSDTMIIAISAGAGGSLLILALVFFFFCRSKKTKDVESAGSNGKSYCDTSYSNNSPQIIVPHNGVDDVSTLGDPAGLYGGQSRKNMFEADDAFSLNTKSMNRMLDASGSHGMDAGGLHDPGECFDVRLPAGKAGIILEEGPDGGVPIVHSVKETSPLYRNIRSGDRLCNIEGLDCTGMTPFDVAKRLQGTEKASSRILTFSRRSM